MQISLCFGVQSGDGCDSVVGYVPAGSQVERFEPFETPGDEQESGVGDVAASAQVEILQVGQVLGYASQTRVGDLFAQTQIESGQRQDVGGEGVSDADVGDVVAAAQVERLDGRKTRDDVTQTSSQRQDLHPADATSGQRWKQ